MFTVCGWRADESPAHANVLVGRRGMSTVFPAVRARAIAKGVPIGRSGRNAGFSRENDEPAELTEAPLLKSGKASETILWAGNRCSPAGVSGRKAESGSQHLPDRFRRHGLDETL